MKKFTLLTLIALVVASFAFAQQRSSEARKVTANTEVQKSVANVLVTSLAESFEGAAFPPNGWAVASPDGGSGWELQTVGTTPVPGFNGGVITAVPNGISGSQMAFCTWTTGGATSNDQWIITPQITISANYNLNFWVRKFGSYADQITVKVSTTDAQPASFTAVVGDLIYVVLDSGWVQSNYSLNAYAGQNIYIAFQEHVADNATDGAAMFLDNVQVSVNAGIDSPEHASSFRIYPNPVSDNLNIETKSVINNVRIANILGSEVLNQKVGENKVRINTSEFNQGVYFVTIETANGNVTRKINITH